MAQRRTGFLGRSMIILLRRPQSEETRPGPPTAGDLARDFRERTVTLPVARHSVVEHRHPMGFPLPLADQDGPCLCLSTLRFLGQASGRGLCCDPREQALSGGLETAESLLLEAVGDRPNQKGP